MSKNTQKQISSQVETSKSSRLVNDPTVPSAVGGLGDLGSGKKYLTIPAPKAFYRRNSTYHLNNNFESNYSNRSGRDWSKVNPQTVMGSAYSYSAQGGFTGYRTAGYRNQNQDWLSNENETTEPQNDHCPNANPEIPSTQRQISNTNRVVEVAVGSSNRGVNAPDMAASLTPSPVSSQRKLDNDVTTNSPSPIPISITVNMSNDKNKPHKKISDAKEKEVQHSSTKRNSKTDKRILEDRRSGATEVKRSRYDGHGRRHSETGGGNRNRNREGNYDNVSDSGGSDGGEDLRSIIRQKHLRKQFRNSRREPGEIIESDEDATQINHSAIPEPKSSTTTNSKKKLKLSTKSTRSVETSKRPRKSGYTEKRIATIENRSTTPPPNPPSALVSPRPVAEPLNPVGEEQQGLFSDDNMSNNTTAGDSQESNNSVGNSSQEAEIQPSSSHLRDRPDPRGPISSHQIEMEAMKCFLDKVKTQLGTETELAINQGKQIADLIRQLRLSEEQNEIKIKAMRGKKTQLENELVAVKGELSKAKRSLQQVEVKLEENIKAKNEEIQRLQRDGSSQDKDKNEMQLVIAMAYQDRLFMEVEKMRSVYEIEILKLQDYYQSRVPSFSFQPVAFGPPMVHNAGVVSSAAAQSTSAVNSVNPLLLNQRENPGNLRTNPPGNQPHGTRNSMFDHLGAPESVVPPMFNVPTSAATRVPMYLNSTIRQSQYQDPTARIPMVPVTGVGNRQLISNSRNPNFTPVSSVFRRDNR